MFLERHIGRHYLTEEDNIVLLRELVSIDSHVNNNNGIQIAQKFLKEKLEALKFNVKFHKNPEIESAPLIIAKRSGRSDAPTVTFIGHSDVVTKPSKVKFKVENNRIYGAGVADDKGGLVVCISALKNFLTIIPDHNLNLNIVISPVEKPIVVREEDEVTEVANLAHQIVSSLYHPMQNEKSSLPLC